MQVIGPGFEWTKMLKNILHSTESEESLYSHGTFIFKSQIILGQDPIPLTLVK